MPSPRTARRQLASLGDDPGGFLFSQMDIAHFDRPYEFFFESDAQASRAQRSGPVFYALYRISTPGGSRQSHEPGKYALTLNAMPKPRYRSGARSGMFDRRFDPIAGFALELRGCDRRRSGPSFEAKRRCADLPGVRSGGCSCLSSGRMKQPLASSCFQKSSTT